MVIDADTLQTLLIIIFGTASLVLILRSKPQDVDASLSEKLDQKQRDRDFMDRLERAYQDSNRQKQATIDTMASLFRLIAPYTPIKSDDAVGRFLDDIRTPGADTNPTTFPPQG